MQLFELRSIVVASLAPFPSLSFLVCPWSNYSKFLPFLLAVKKTAQRRQTPKKGGRAMERCSQTRQICFLCLSAILSCSLRLKWSAHMSQYVKIICIATSHSCAHCICVWEREKRQRGEREAAPAAAPFWTKLRFNANCFWATEEGKRGRPREPLCIRRPFLPSPPMSHPLTVQL